LVDVFVFLEKKRKEIVNYSLYTLVIWYRIYILLFLVCIFVILFKSQQLMKHNPDVKSETNGSTLIEKKEKKIKKSQSTDSTSLKEPRKERKLSRKRVCLV